MCNLIQLINIAKHQNIHLINTAKKNIHLIIIRLNI